MYLANIGRAIWIPSSLLFWRIKFLFTMCVPGEPNLGLIKSHLPERSLQAWNSSKGIFKPYLTLIYGFEIWLPALENATKIQKLPIIMMLYALSTAISCAISATNLFKLVIWLRFSASIWIGTRSMRLINTQAAPVPNILAEDRIKGPMKYLGSITPGGEAIELTGTA